MAELPESDREALVEAMEAVWDGGASPNEVELVEAMLRNLTPVVARIAAKAADEREAEVRERLAEDFAQRAAVYEGHPEHDTDRYLDGVSTAYRVAEKIVRAALAQTEEPRS